MFRIIIQLSTLFVLQYVRVESISISSIVRLKCDAHLLAANKSCVGTLILPNIALTTAYCAETCRYVNDVPIRNFYSHPHYKNYVKGNYLFARNDVGLVVIGFKTKNRNKIVKLSALDAVSSVGLKAFIPMIDVEKPRLDVTIVEKCDKRLNMPMGYFVCTTNKLTGKTKNVCRERLELGIPLLLDDKIFALSGLTSEHQYQLPQNTFIAIGPVLSWIGSTLKKLGYEEHEEALVRNNFAIATSSSPVPATNIGTADVTVTEKRVLRKLFSGDQRYPFPAILRTSTQMSPEFKTTKRAETTHFVGTTAIKFIPRGHRPKLTPKSTNLVNVSIMHETAFGRVVASRLSTTLSPQISALSLTATSPRNVPSSSSTLTSRTSSIIPNNLTTLVSSLLPIASFSSTRMTSLSPTLRRLSSRISSTSSTTLSSPTISTSLTTSPSLTVSSTNTPSSLKTSTLKNGTTNVMEWFNEKLKLNLRIGTPPVLIVGSSKSSIFNRTTLFIDLT